MSGQTHFINVTAVLTIALAFIMISCGSSESDRLKERAQQWFSLLRAIESSSPSEKEILIRKLTAFIEPSAANTQRAAEYYERWHNSSSKLISSSVDDVKIDGTTGIVRSSDVWQLESGEKITASQETKWRRIEKTWFRIIQPAKISVGTEYILF